MPYPSTTLYPSETLYPEDVVGTPSIAPGVRVAPADWLAASLELNGGGQLRFGAGERDTERLPNRIEFSTQMPGGFQNGSLVAPRPTIVSALDAQRFASVRIYGPGNRTAYEGRVTGIPRVGANEIELSLEGWVSHLDDGTFREIFVDQDLNSWQAMSRQRRINLLSGGVWSPRDGQVEPDTTTGMPALLQEIEDAWASPFVPIVETWYDCGSGLDWGFIYIDLVAHASSGGNWKHRLFSATDDVAGGALERANFDATTSGTGYSGAGSEGRFAFLQFQNSVTPGGAAGGRYTRQMRSLTIYGTHGLTRRGASHPQGFYVSDMLAYALTQSASLLNFTEGTDGSIEPSTFVVPQAVFTEVDNTARKTIEVLNGYGGDSLVPNDWGVYEDREFFWKTPRSYGREWRLRKDTNVTPSDEGPAGNPANGAIVSWQDPAGSTHVVGPPGSGLSDTSTSLEDTSDDNPVNAAGIPSKVIQVNAGLTSRAGAILIGQLALEEANRDERQGSLEVTGPVRDSTGAVYPAWMLRAGDDSGIEEDVDTPNAGILTTTYTHDANTRRLSGAVGAVPHRLETLLSRSRVVSE